MPSPIDLVAGRPLLYQATRARAGAYDHIGQHRYRDNRDGGRL